MKRLLKVAGVFTLLVGLLFAVPLDADADGGSVTSNGAIIFKQGTADTTESSEPSSSEPVPSESAEPEPSSSSSIDPGGKLPDTGELIRRGLSISGIILLAASVFFILWRRKKKDKEDEDDEKMAP